MVDGFVNTNEGELIASPRYIKGATVMKGGMFFQCNVKHYKPEDVDRLIDAYKKLVRIVRKENVGVQ